MDSPQSQTHTFPLGSSGSRGLLQGGTTGNELLTTVTGAVLIVLLAVIGITIIRLGPLLSVHLFVGLVLVGPLLLKLASTGYRFVGYYTGNPRYRSRGAPPTPLRLIAPIVVISTVTVMVSGVALLFVGPQSRSTLLPIHKVSFFIWIAFTSIHVLGHLPTLLQGLRADYGTRLGGHVTDGRAGRVLSLASALVLGVVIAILLIPQFGPWLHTHNLHHH
ncbi:MAG: hypothetical protein ACRDJ3_03715 [Solirubrobacteraceae bacterium]